MTDKFHTIAVGQTAELKHHITWDDVKRFADLTGDDNPLHLDPAYAARTRFQDAVAHGMLSASFVSTIIGRHLPGPGSLWLSQSFEFAAPVRVGDEITIRAVVSAKNESLRLLTIDCEVLNQHGQTVIKGSGQVQVLETEEAVPTAAAASQRVAIVTGANRGIGAAVARRLAADGCAVVVNYRSDAAAAARLVREIEDAGGRAIACEGDVLDAKAIRRLVETARAAFGDPSVLVNNATAPLHPKPFEETTDDDLLHNLDINYLAPLRLIRELLPGFRRLGGGSVVSIGTVTTDGAPPKNMFAYTASKAAIITATRCLAVEFGHEGIRFNAVSPGFTNTRLVAGLSDRARLLTKAQTPLGKLAEPAEIAAAVAFLASPDASHITGETLRVNGGFVML